jgi:hypothetical protein
METELTKKKRKMKKGKDPKTLTSKDYSTSLSCLSRFICKLNTWFVQIALLKQLVMFRTVRIVIPVYIILITATALLCRCNQQHLYRIQVYFYT